MKFKILRISPLRNIEDAEDIVNDWCAEHSARIVSHTFFHGALPERDQSVVIVTLFYEEP